MHLQISRIVKRWLHPLEVYFLQKGYSVIGIDEVGRGCIAGPIVTGGVVLTYSNLEVLREIEALLQGAEFADSKKLKVEVRARLAKFIINRFGMFATYGVGVQIIDSKGISHANMLAMTRVAEYLQRYTQDPTVVLVDGLYAVRTLRINVPTVRVLKGDEKLLSVKLGGIVAKYIRDYIMTKKYHKRFPYYDFRNNKGYSTPAHRLGLEKYGLASVHRRSFIVS